MILDSPQEDLLLLGAVDSEAQGAPEHTSHQGNPRYVALRSPPPPPPPPATPFSSSTFFHRFLIQKTVLPDARSRQAVIKSQAVSHDGIFSTLESTLKFHLWGLVLIIKSLMLELGSCLWKWIQSFERLTCGGQIGHPSIWPVLLENAACAFIVGHSVFFFFFFNSLFHLIISRGHWLLLQLQAACPKDGGFPTVYGSMQVWRLDFMVHSHVHLICTSSYVIKPTFNLLVLLIIFSLLHFVDPTNFHLCPKDQSPRSVSSLMMFTRTRTTTKAPSL